MQREDPPQAAGLLTGLHTLAGRHTATARVAAGASVAHGIGVTTANVPEHVLVHPAAHRCGVVVSRQRPRD